jgi:hypothetical protein
MYLQLPLYAALRKNISNNLNISIGFGPYFGYGIGGKIKKKLNGGMYSDGSTETIWDTFENGIYDEERYWLQGEVLKRFDFGAGFNVDFEYNKLVLGVGLESSIIDIMNYDRDLHYRNINIRISTGYRF